MWANCSGCLPKIIDHERFAQVAYQKWANRWFFWANRSIAHFFTKNDSLRKLMSKFPALLIIILYPSPLSSSYSPYAINPASLTIHPPSSLTVDPLPFIPHSSSHIPYPSLFNSHHWSLILPLPPSSFTLPDSPLTLIIHPLYLPILTLHPSYTNTHQSPCIPHAFNK